MKTADWIKKRTSQLNPNNNARVTPDPGSSKNIKKQTLLDKTQEIIEDVDAAIANTGAIANIASVSKIPSLAKTGSFITGIASKSEPLLLALTTLDATRGLIDKNYREANLNAIKKIGEDPKSGILGGALDNRYFNTSVGLQAFDRPVTTGGALIRLLMESRDKINKSKNIEKDVELKLKRLKKQYAEQEARKKQSIINPNQIIPISQPLS